MQNDLINFRVGNDFASKLGETLKKIDVSQTDVGPAEALRAVNQLLGEPEDERRILYIISDYRVKEWNDPGDVKKLLQEWQAKEEEKIRLVDCVENARPNLAIQYLKPEEGIRAAGVPWFMEVAVTNFNKSPAKDVSVALGEDGHVRPSVFIAGNSARPNRERAIPSEFSSRKDRTRLPPGWKATQWRPIIIVFTRSICLPTFRR